MKNPKKQAPPKLCSYQEMQNYALMPVFLNIY